MKKMIDYSGKEVCFEGCVSCAYDKAEFKLDCEDVLRDGDFTLTQDFELPIVGFLVLCPVFRHVEKISELSDSERNRMFEIVNKTISILEKHKVCENYLVIFQEKEGVHLHIWLMPQHDWMKEKFGKITRNIGNIFDYAKQNLRTPENLEEIKRVCTLVKQELGQQLG